ncbi:hypothetical protein CFC21_080608 [Triticum aestivum]|uniref:BED-type domain-containing protein n=5 Tax=Triticinae TaxID=1648030 RepID=A0A453MB47_AEGTS|nr:protein NLP4 [Aegilops tauschii subsp. strangulata]XP_044400013.1 protein NLP4-like [Triticum aestivum]XP_044400014.1 protein NLP4-like [Triticum aestivum]KAF7075875.1 hypothetical protein CFC21_080608 [Triticum aestivum]
MEEGGFQVQPGTSVRFTASPESPDIDWDGLDLVPLPGDISWPEVGIDASSLFASSSIFLSDGTTTTAATNTFLSPPNTCSSQPGTRVAVAHTMASEGAMVDLDELLSGDDPWLQVATIASSSTSFFDSPSTFPSDATTNRGTLSFSPGAAVDSDHVLEQPLFLSPATTPAWLHFATDASSCSPSSFASPSTFLLDATTDSSVPASRNTCLIQTSIPVPRTTLSQCVADDLDLPEQLLPDDKPWFGVAPNTSRSPNFFATPSIFPSDAKSTMVTVRERLTQALAYIEEMQRDKHVLLQVWVPTMSYGQLVLTTRGMPFTLNKSSERLVQFRDVSTRYQLSADVASKGSPVGLPGRVFIGKLPEWSPDVRYFTSYEYPMVAHAQYLDVHGTMGLPVFEKGNPSCLGVIELIMTRQKLNFTSEINNICSALQAVNLRSSEVSSIPRAKFSSASYKDALPEILEVLRAACVTHNLPLAQTWATCAQQWKRGSRHSDENYQHCISTIDAACYVNDPQMQNFHDSCSDHHLLLKQGVAGKAFTTNQPCFLPDIGSSAKPDYPLCHHAKIFNLKGAVAIRLRCTRTGTADFVLEFFLPTDCEALEEQKAVLDTLSGTMQNVCQTLRTVTDKELEDDAMKPNSFGGLQMNKKANKRKPMAPRSTVWKSFTKVMVGDTVKAKCNYCGENYCCESKNGTSSLISHLKRCKLNPNKSSVGVCIYV